MLEVITGQKKNERIAWSRESSGICQEQCWTFMGHFTGWQKHKGDDIGLKVQG